MPLLDLVGSIISAGDKPVVPDYEAIDFTDQQKKSVEGNASVLPGALDIAGKVNRFNSDEIERMLKEFVGADAYSDIRKGVGDNIVSELKGEVPKDVQNAISQRAAERGVSSFGGSSSPGGIGRYNEMKQLGLTSLNQISKGMNDASRWMSQAQQMEAPLFNPTGFFSSPKDQYMAAVGEREFKFGRQWMQNKIDAAPDPTMAAIGQWMQRTDQAVFNTALSVAGSYAGGAMGGGGGGGGGGSKGPDYGRPVFDYNAGSNPYSASSGTAGAWY